MTVEIPASGGIGMLAQAVPLSDASGAQAKGDGPIPGTFDSVLGLLQFALGTGSAIPNEAQAGGARENRLEPDTKADPAPGTENAAAASALTILPGIPLPQAIPRPAAPGRQLPDTAHARALLADDAVAAQARPAIYRQEGGPPASTEAMSAASAARVQALVNAGLVAGSDGSGMTASASLQRGPATANPPLSLPAQVALFGDGAAATAATGAVAKPRAPGPEAAAQGVLGANAQPSGVAAGLMDQAVPEAGLAQTKPVTLPREQADTSRPDIPAANFVDTGGHGGEVADSNPAGPQSHSAPGIAGKPPGPDLSIARGASGGLEDLVDRLVDAREHLREVRGEIVLRHADFGAIRAHISDRIEGLHVALSNHDPDFAPSIQTALGDRSPQGQQQPSHSGSQHDASARPDRREAPEKAQQSPDARHSQKGRSAHHRDNSLFA